MNTAEIIRVITELVNNGIDCIGIRADDRLLEVGEYFGNSHQLYQDAPEDESIELVESGPYAGFYDAGELEGTCTLGIRAEPWELPTEEYIEKIIKKIAIYPGKHIYLVQGDSKMGGNDIGESIIENAKVAAIIK